MSKKLSRIVLPEDKRFVQPNLFTPPTSSFNPFPEILPPEKFHNLLINSSGDIGIDLEFYQDSAGKYHPSILGIAAGNACVGINWREDAARDVINVALRDRRLLIGYSIVGADRPVLSQVLKTEVPLLAFGDAMQTHFLCNQDFAKSTFKEEDEGSLGFMNLWTAASMTTDLPRWKSCAGRYCDHYVCPTHAVHNYCAVDAWSGLRVHEENLKEMSRFGVPMSTYHDMLELSEIAHLMEEQGLAIDRVYLEALRREMKEHKDAIFEHTGSGKERVYKNFNPNAPEQIRDWFHSHGLELENTEKRTIFKTLEKAAKSHGFESVDELRECEHPISEVLGELLKLFEYKDSGKGPDPWFGDKYFRADGLIHPRFITTGASSTRWASSKPNCFDAMTEILTKVGWKFVSELTMQDAVAQWWPSGSINFTLPNFLISKKSEGVMVSIENTHIDLRVTGDHRCPLVHRKTKKLVEFSAEMYPQDYLQMNGGIYNGGPGLDLTSAELQFLVAVQADGSYSGNAIKFAFVKSRKIERLRVILQGYTYTEIDEGVVTFRVTDARLKDLVVEYLGEIKCFGSWIFDLSRQQLDIFCDELFHWDGAFQTKHNYASRNKINADLVQAALVLSNRRTNTTSLINTCGSKSYQCHVTQSRNYSLTTNIKKKKEYGSEMVYCLSVPSSYVVVRRNGKVVITGQCQNIGRRGWAKKIKQCIVPRDPKLQFLESDSSQLELRLCLWLAGVDPKIADTLFEDLVIEGGGAYERAAKFAKIPERDVVKSTVHAGNYLETFNIYTENDLRRDNVRKEIKNGSIRLYEDWEYGGGVVGFTGINLAERLFGSRTYEYRKQALDLREMYVRKVPQLVIWQKKELALSEKRGYVQLPTGHFLRLYGSPRDNAKITIATLGQGGGAQYVQGVMLRFRREKGRIPCLFVHDSLMFEIDRGMSNKEAYEFISLMYEETDRMKGFKAPGKATRGDSYGDLEPLVT